MSERDAGGTTEANVETLNTEPFLKYVQVEPGLWSHWLWLGPRSSAGYGTYWDKVAKKVWPAHRFSYTAFIGPIPDGLVIDHLCGVHNCVKPSHLEAVTSRVNGQRAGQARALQNWLDKIHGHAPVRQKYTHLTVTMSENRWDHLRIVAKSDKRSLNSEVVWIVTGYIEQWLKQQEQRDV